MNYNMRWVTANMLLSQSIKMLYVICNTISCNKNYMLILFFYIFMKYEGQNESKLSKHLKISQSKTPYPYWRCCDKRTVCKDILIKVLATEFWIK